MNKTTKTFITTSFLGLIISGIISWFFGGYNPIIRIGPTILAPILLLLGIVIPVCILVVAGIYGITGLFKNDWRRFVVLSITSLSILLLMSFFTLPPLLVK